MLGYPPDAPALIGRERTWTADDLRRDVGAVCAALGPPATARLLLCQSRHAFAVGMLACWQRGEVVVLPPNLSPETVALVARSCDGVLHDGASELGTDLRSLLSREAPALTWRTPSDDTVLVRLSTSGSTGAVQHHNKTARQLLGEARALGRRFELTSADIVLATIPPHHIYGLLFSLLLPLLHGAAVVDDCPFFAESIAARLQSSGATVLVTVPAHLRAIAASGNNAFTLPRLVFSSGAPLPERTASELAEAYDTHVTEVFGSTETGGIAWRRRRQLAHWTPLAGVTVTEGQDGRLLLTSPFLPADAPVPYPADDRIEAAPNGRFVHQGRLDDVVKIASKRVSLGAVERALLDLPGVTDAAVMPVDRSGRIVLRAAVVSTLSEAQLREALLTQLDPVAVPRVRRVESLPRQANGKLTRADLQALLAPSELGVGPLARPTEHVAHYEIRVPQSYRWFEGHFPGRPVLPGVVQLHRLVMPQVLAAWPGLGDPVSVPTVKFRRAILPGDRLQLRLSRDGLRVAFTLLTEAGAPCTTGTLLHEERAHA